MTTTRRGSQSTKTAKKVGTSTDLNKDIKVHLNKLGEGHNNEIKGSTGHITVHKLKVVSVNARSIMNKFDELHAVYCS